MFCVRRQLPWFAIGILLLPSLTTSSAGAQMIRKGEPPPDAYVLVGHLDQKLAQQVSAAALAAFGTDADVYKVAEPLVQKKIRELQAMGYRVKILRSATKEMFRRALSDPNARAIAWFTHGDQAKGGTIHAAAENGGIETFGHAELKQWAQEKWARSQGWDGKGTVDAWIQRVTPDPATENKLRLEAEKARLGFEYAYFHTCNSFDNRNLADVIIRPDAKSRVFGYQGTKYGFDEKGVKEAAFVGGKTIIGKPADIEAKRQQALEDEEKQAREARAVRERDPDLEEVAVKPAAPPAQTARKAAQVSDPDLEETPVRRPRRSTVEDPVPPAPPAKAAEPAAKQPASSTPALFRTTWQGQMTVQQEGEDAQVVAFRLSVDAGNRVAISWKQGVWAAGDGGMVQKEMEAKGSYDSRSGRIEAEFDQSFVRDDSQTEEEEIWEPGKDGVLTKVGTRTVVLERKLTLHVWGSFSGVADSSTALRGTFTIREQGTWKIPNVPKVAASLSDKEPGVTEGTWRAQRSR